MKNEGVLPGRKLKSFPLYVYADVRDITESLQERLAKEGKPLNSGGILVEFSSSAARLESRREFLREGILCSPRPVEAMRRDLWRDFLRGARPIARFSLAPAVFGPFWFAAKGLTTKIFVVISGTLLLEAMIGAAGVVAPGIPGGPTLFSFSLKLGSVILPFRVGLAAATLAWGYAAFFGEYDLYLLRARGEGLWRGFPYSKFKIPFTLAFFASLAAWVFACGKVEHSLKRPIDAGTTVEVSLQTNLLDRTDPRVIRRRLLDASRKISMKDAPVLPPGMEHKDFIADLLEQGRADAAEAALRAAADAGDLKARETLGFFLIIQSTLYAQAGFPEMTGDFIREAEALIEEAAERGSATAADGLPSIRDARRRMEGGT